MGGDVGSFGAAGAESFDGLELSRCPQQLLTDGAAEVYRRRYARFTDPCSHGDHFS